ncbi:MAG: hypothetical protein JJ879_03700 [Sneathiella sp.]|nr:hypothetical protein [Sneathiella sp.]
MKKMIILSLLLGGFLPVGTATTYANTNQIGIATEVVAHGGGCRKSSPPGQCCHMERKTGIVHCH